MTLVASDDVHAYRKRKMDMEQQMLAWRVHYEDIEFMGTLTSSAGSTTVYDRRFLLIIPSTLCSTSLTV